MKQTLISLFFLCFYASMNAQISGALDPRFGVNGKVTTAFRQGHDGANALLVQTDGKIVVAGESSRDTNRTYPHKALVRYKPDGTLDNTFGTAGKTTTPFGLSSSINAMVLQTDGKIVAVGGAMDSTQSRNNFALARYQPNGFLDKSFGDSGKVTTAFSINPNAASFATAVALQTDGKILVAGTYYLFNGADWQYYIAVARYNSKGILDTSFNNTGKITRKISDRLNDVATSIAVQSDNKIVICGTSKSATEGDICLVDPPDLFVIRYNHNGSLDTTFGTDGVFIQNEAEASTIKILSNGKMLIAGNTNYVTTHVILFRLNTNGFVDATFNFDAPTVGKATDMCVQTDGKIVLAGSSYNAATSNFDFILMRCSPEGILDNTFGQNGKILTLTEFFLERYSKIAIQGDGKILACGRSKNSITGDFKVNFNVIRYNNENIGTGVETTEKINLAIYPNPTNGALTIDTKNLTGHDATVKITDRIGRLVWQNTFTQINTTLPLNINHLAAGLYIVEIISVNKHWAQLIAKY